MNGIVKLQAWLVAALGIATAFAGLLALDGHGESLEALGFGGPSVVEGALYLALAATVARHSRIASLVACGLILLDAGLQLVHDHGVSGPAGLAVLMARIAVLMVLLRELPRPSRPLPIVSEALQMAARTLRDTPSAAARPHAVHEHPLPVTTLIPARKTELAVSLAPRSRTEDVAGNEPRPSIPIETQSVPARTASELPATSPKLQTVADTRGSAASEPPPSPLPLAMPQTFANVVDNEGQIRCPKCGMRQIDGSRCFGCGIDFARYWDARRRVFELEARLGRSNPR